jgi:predicted transcriptional regulator
MSDSTHDHLGRRERQIMDVLYRLKRATVAEVLENLSDPPSYSAVRAMLRILEDKGHALHAQEGPRYVYMPVVAPDHAQRSILGHVVDTFFEGSPAQAAAALLETPDLELSTEELDRLSRLIDQARRQGR